VVLRRCHLPWQRTNICPKAWGSWVWQNGSQFGAPILARLVQRNKSTWESLPNESGHSSWLFWLLLPFQISHSGPGQASCLSTLPGKPAAGHQNSIVLLILFFDSFLQKPRAMPVANTQLLSRPSFLPMSPELSNVHCRDLELDLFLKSFLSPHEALL
jgi:hypothetical protein